MRLVRTEEGSPPPSEAELLSRARGGDGAAFRELFVRHGPTVRRLLGGLFREPQDADEATQETFVRAHSLIAHFRDASRIGTWLVGIARAVWLDEADRQRREARLPARAGAQAQRLAASPESRFLEGEADQALAKALDRLAPARRMAVTGTPSRTAGLTWS